MEMTRDEWIHISEALQAHFDPASVQWRPQGKPTPGARVQILAYIDARQIQDRLDSVCPGWGFDWTPMHVDSAGVVTSAKGTITIAGTSRSDIGTASSWDPSKGAVSDALKRAAVQWGVGRYLYGLLEVWVQLDSQGHIPEAFLAKLRTALTNRASAQIAAPASVVVSLAS